MAKGMYRTVDGLVMVEYGSRKTAISRAIYKANGYRPLYEKLERESVPIAKEGLDPKVDKKTSPAEPSCSQCQNWRPSDAKLKLEQASNLRPRTR